MSAPSALDAVINGTVPYPITVQGGVAWAE